MEEKMTDTIVIDFYDAEAGAVKITWPSNSKQAENYEARLYADTLLFACYTLRQIRNLGRNPVSKALAEHLINWNPISAYKNAERVTKINLPNLALHQHIILDAAIEMGMSWDTAHEKYGEPLILTEYHGVGKKRFIGNLNLTNNIPKFDLSSNGFFLGKDINQYAPDSVFLLLSFLEATYADNWPFLDGLQKVVMKCANAYMKNEIGMKNQESLAVKFVTDQ
jgi:hypothetical protein